MNKKSGYQVALNILVSLPLIVIVFVVLKLIWKYFPFGSQTMPDSLSIPKDVTSIDVQDYMATQPKAQSGGSRLTWISRKMTGANNISRILSSIQSTDVSTNNEKLYSILTNNELTRSIKASIVAVLCVGGITGMYMNTGGNVFDNMIYNQMAFGNILGFVLDQLYAKHEGRLLFSRHKQRNNIFYNIKNKTYAINNIGHKDYEDLDLNTDYLQMSKSNYLPHKMLSKQFLKFIITVIIDMCASSYLTNIVTTWAKEHNMFPKCYTKKLCDRPSNSDTTDTDEDKTLLYPFGVKGPPAIGFEKKTIDYWFKLAINTIVGLITFYLYVNKTRIFWAYIPKPKFEMNFIIVIFSIVAVFMYMNQETVSTPTFYQTINGKRYLGIGLFTLLLLVEYWPFGNDRINKFIKWETSSGKFWNKIISTLCLLFMVTPVFLAFQKIKIESVINNCHDEIYKKMRQAQSVITHFHDVDDISEIDTLGYCSNIDNKQTCNKNNECVWNKNEKICQLDQCKPNITKPKCDSNTDCNWNITKNICQLDQCTKSTEDECIEDCKWDDTVDPPICKYK